MTDTGIVSGVTHAPAVSRKRAKRSNPAATLIGDMEDIILDEDEEVLAPAVVVATLALIAVFVVGFVIFGVGLVF